MLKKKREERGGDIERTKKRKIIIKIFEEVKKRL